MLNRFHLIPKRYGQTDRRTDGQNCYINISRQCGVSVLTRSKNHPILVKFGTQQQIWNSVVVT